MRLVVFLALALVPAGTLAQVPAEPPPRPLVVMNLAAHPDDEDGLTMAYYRYRQNAVVYSVIYTRGEGGQNEVGPDLYEHLGAIRTAETEAAARILGTQVFYLNRYDFGYSKHAGEAFAEWASPRRSFWDPLIRQATGEDAAPNGDPEAAGRAALTADLVRLIRMLKPDVLFTNHDTVTVQPGAQHGHHQAVGITAYDAFALAADPAYAPEQLQEPGVDLWQPARLFLRDAFGRTESPDVSVPVSTPLAGRDESAADLAVRAAAQHVSQGFDKFAPRFYRDTTHFRLLRAAPDAPPLPEGATDLAAGLPPHPNARQPDWKDLFFRLDAGRISPLPYDITLAQPVATPGVGVAVLLDGNAEHPDRLRVSVGQLDRNGRSSEAGITPNAGSLPLPVSPVPESPYTVPAYRFQYDRLVSQPPFAVLQLGPEGERAERLRLGVAPPVVIETERSPILLRPGDNTLGAVLTVYDPRAQGAEVGLLVTRDGEPVLQSTQTVALPQPLAPGSDVLVSLHIPLPADAPAGAYAVSVGAHLTHRPEDADAVTRYARVLPALDALQGRRIGFVYSYDDATPEALERMGAEVVLLDSLDLAGARFDGLDTIVVGIRAYLTREDLRAHNANLLGWVERGGHLVVEYHKSFEWNADRTHPLTGAANARWAPFPLQLSRARVTEEDAPVTLLQPSHPFFSAPYAIVPEDWSGWVQERGLYFPTTYDDAYQELLETGDTGEAPLRGGLLVARHGAGTYVYSPLVWYRQLGALHPGAHRLLANLVTPPGGFGGSGG